MIMGKLITFPCLIEKKRIVSLPCPYKAKVVISFLVETQSSVREFMRLIPRYHKCSLIQTGLYYNR